MRYEDDFGSFWMVDDAEFMKRRHLSRGRPRKYEPSSSSNNSQSQSQQGGGQQQQQPPLPQQPPEIGNRKDAVTSSNLVVGGQFKLTGAVAGGGGSQAKSPSFAPNPSMYSDALNASLQSALGFAENNLPFLAHSGASMASFHHHQQQQRERENADKHSLERPSSVDYASKLLGSNASSYLSPSSMSDTENNNTSDKLEDPRSSSPLRINRKRPASADLDGELVQDEEDEDQLHFKQRPSSVEQKSNYEYNTSGNPDVGYGLVDGRSSVSSTKDEQLLLKDISMLREDRVKHEKY